jgi:hypothetical protein
MVFQPKYKNSGDTKHLRMPIAYSDLIEELILVLDKNYPLEKGRHLLRKYINNLT